MTETIATARIAEKAVLIGVINQQQDEKTVNEYLAELRFLTETAGAVPVKTFTQRLDIYNPKTFIGMGKLQEIEAYIKNHEIDVVIFDDELSPSQLRNIERVLERRILDRTNLILDIFARRARTSYAKKQVQLAQYEYILPRLTRMWTHLERQRGGIGLRGPGETEIETDRRVIRDKISKLKVELEKIDRQMSTQRKNRGKMVRVALVGYTNVGKSTIMNMLSKSDVFAEDKLFATLDTTVRKVVIENLPFLLSDTVGFIRKLPHSLVESFKSTLDEVREADILLHIVDLSHPGFEEQMNIVNETLKEINAADKPTYIIFNKIDTIQNPDSVNQKNSRNGHDLIEDLKRSWMSRSNGTCVFISAKYKINIEGFKETLYDNIKTIHASRYPYNDFLY
ncbi:GTPase HflX [Bacteroidota bacterium]